MDERFTSLCRLDHTIHLGDQLLPVAMKLEWEWWQEGGKIGGGGVGLRTCVAILVENHSSLLIQPFLLGGGG